MPKAVLEFNLPEECEEFMLAQNGSVYSSIISDLDNYLRSALKHKELTDEETRIYQEIRDLLHESLDAHAVR